MDTKAIPGPFTPYCPPRPAIEWIRLITELDSLIDRYCEAAKLSPEAKARILAARCSQPLATIPESVTWFRKALDAIDAPGAGYSSVSQACDSGPTGSPFICTVKSEKRFF